MKIGVLIPTADEIDGLPKGIPAAVAFGPGKTAACAAAAKLLFQDGCDAILLWGSAGACHRRLAIGDVVIADEVAYNDYDVAPLYGSTGMGFVPEIAEDCWMKCDQALSDKLAAALKRLFPNINITHGRISAGDVFDNAKYKRPNNRIEEASDCVEMEGPAVAHFCKLTERFTGKHIPMADIRMVVNYVGADAAEEFLQALALLKQINQKMADILA